MICGLGHDTVAGIHFPHQMTFPNTADGGVTGHLTQGFNAVADQQRIGTTARCRQRCIGACMAPADYDDIKTLGEIHGWCLNSVETEVYTPKVMGSTVVVLDVR